MSKTIARKPATAKTIANKNARVFKSSHGKFSSIVELEEHRKSLPPKKSKAKVAEETNRKRVEYQVL